MSIVCAMRNRWVLRLLCNFPSDCEMKDLCLVATASLSTSVKGLACLYVSATVRVSLSMSGYLGFAPEWNRGLVKRALHSPLRHARPCGLVTPSSCLKDFLRAEDAYLVGSHGLISVVLEVERVLAACSRRLLLA